MFSQSPFPVASSVVLLTAGSVVTAVLPVLEAASRTGGTALGSVRCELAANQDGVAVPHETGGRLRVLPDVGAEGQTFDVDAAVFITHERMDDGVVTHATLHRLEGCCSKCGEGHLLNREGKPLACRECGVTVRVETTGDRS